MTSSDQPDDNAKTVAGLIDQAAASGARLVCTPEVTNCVSISRTHQSDVLQTEGTDTTLAAARERAAHHGVWVALGSLALKDPDGDGRFVNRSFLIDSRGKIAARYDKIHMFDVDVSKAETYRESDGFRPGSTAVIAEVDGVTLGLTICYDLRFPALYRTLAQAGAQVLLIPAAFTPPTGAAHWHTLLRARAIETGCFVLAAAQTGTHPASSGRARSTYGHSLAVSPWGEVLVDAGTAPGVSCLDLDIDEVATTRARLPSLQHDRPFKGP